MYHERLSSPRTQTLFVVLSLLFLSGFAWLARAGSPGWVAWALLGLGLVFGFYVLNYHTLHIDIDEQRLLLRFGLFRCRVPLNNIEAVEMDPVSLWRIGGAGIHFTWISGRYRVMFNFLQYERLLIHLKRRQWPVVDVAFSSAQPGQIQALVESRRNHA